MKTDCNPLRSGRQNRSRLEVKVLSPGRSPHPVGQGRTTRSSGNCSRRPVAYPADHSETLDPPNRTIGLAAWHVLSGQLVAHVPLGLFLMTLGVCGALHAAPGDLKWEFLTEGVVNSSPAIGADGTIYVGSDDGKLYALDGATGQKRWEFQTGAAVVSSPSIGDDGTVYVGSKDGIVYALNGVTGQKKWQFLTDDWVESSPAVGADGTVYIGSHDGRVYALVGATGEKRWEFLTGGPIRSSPAIGTEGTVYVASYDGYLHALDGTTGQEKWECKIGANLSSSLAIGPDGTVYVGGGAVYAVNGATGLVNWEFSENDTYSSPVVGINGTLYVLGPPKLLALDGITGQKKWEFVGGGGTGPSSCPALAADGTLYIWGSRNLYAVNSANGQREWDSPTVNAIWSSPSIGTNGAIYFGGYDKKVYAIEGHTEVGLAGGFWPKFQGNVRNTGRALESRPIFLGSELSDQRVAQQSTVLFTVSAGGARPLHHQWFYQGTALPGETNRTLALTNVQLTNAGDYFVTLSNQLGMITSRVARLTVGYRLSVAKSNQSCTVQIRPAQDLYEPNDQVELTAVPSPEVTFLGWGGDASGTMNPIIVLMDGNKSVIASFSFSPGMLKWQSESLSAQSSPAIGLDGTIYIASIVEKVYALDSATGQTKWKVPGNDFWSDPAIGEDGTVYVAAPYRANLRPGAGAVYALDGLTGRRKWTSQMGDRVISSPALGADGTVYVGSGDGKLYALEGATGRKRWDYATGDGVCGSPAIGGDGTVYVGSDHRVHALDGATGRKKWESAAVESSVAIGADGTVYATSGDHRVYANGTGYVESSDYKVYALDGATGRKKWQFQTGTNGYVWGSSPTIGGDGTVYVGSLDQKVYALDGATGLEKWESPAGIKVMSSPAIGADGTVYVGSDGGLYALDGVTGREKWRYPFASFSSFSGPPAIGADGTVYTSGGKALASSSVGGLARSPWPTCRGNAQNTGRVQCLSAPTLLQDLKDLRVAEGSTVSFSVATACPLRYQWFFQGVTLPGQSNQTLTLTNTQMARTGSYFVTVSNPFGTITSRVATLTVGYALTIINNNSACQVLRRPDWEVYEPGCQVELTAMPGGGNTFVGWSGDVTGTTNTVVITMDGPKRVLANFSLGQGQFKWAFSTGDAIHCGPAIGADGTVYVGSRDKKVYAVDCATGERKWEFLTGNYVYSSPAVGAEGTVYVGSEDGKVYALDGGTGQKRWEFLTGDHVSGGPALGAFGLVYVGSFDTKVYALESATGTKQWEFLTGGSVASSPAIGADGTVYVGSRDRKVYALAGATGEKRWDFLTGAAVDSSPAIGPDGTVYVGSGDQKVYALDGLTGQPKWTYTTGAGVSSSPALATDGTVYVGSWDGKLYALDGATGQKKWDYATGDMIFSSPGVAWNGTVYVGSRDKRLYALEGATGAKQWEYVAADYIYGSPAIGTDGTVYLGASDGKLYAIAGGSVGGLADSSWPKFRRDARNTGCLSAVPVVLQLRSPSFSTNGFGLMIQRPVGQSVWLDATTNLNDWIPLVQFTNPAVTFGWQDPDSIRMPQRFYRLRMP